MGRCLTPSLLSATLSIHTNHFMKLKNIAVGLTAAAAAFFSGTPALANINNMRDHEVLWDALSDSGVTMVMNTPSICDDNTMGAYASYQGLLFVCQERAQMPYKATAWTAEDLDTLRHEGHHVVQDCLDGKMGDNNFDLLFDDPDEFEQFVRGSLTQNQIDQIIVWYGDQSPEDILIELEAFAVANSVSADKIAEAVTKVCAAAR